MGMNSACLKAQSTCPSLAYLQLTLRVKEELSFLLCFLFTWCLTTIVWMLTPARVLAVYLGAVRVLRLTTWSSKSWGASSPRSTIHWTKYLPEWTGCQRQSMAPQLPKGAHQQSLALVPGPTGRDPPYRADQPGRTMRKAPGMVWASWTCPRPITDWWRMSSWLQCQMARDVGWGTSFQCLQFQVPLCI